ncbi:hypothetical protein CAOG_08211 [Capsaspora owczarzaki ATCC 30864]|uniref:Uncharacterized protein n=1 Tax=Capsaspora owczarzaki (strain ATCC 30864) TaxID=595528 RepID=A0A0D2WYT0_CAPO3|nr:hypothetical protein CAOG_08211 [Capsaspora owczarzaki ATCC 30864]KJE98213.1 hypothetical protein CAOG_008211 [Capsaspora owczarzaki ATCC 30864]|eukprot:XP_004342466.1 hypothetical protein CAOG_08211 [Capsaspora owczarzaki ATCC 30864]
MTALALTPNTRLQEAIRSNDLAAVQLELQNGFDHAATILAVRLQRSAIAQYLVKAGVDPMPGLIAAVSTNDKQMLEVLLAAGANPNPTETGQSRAVLEVGLIHAHVALECVQLLLAAGANPNHWSAMRRPPLAISTGPDMVDITRAMLAAGADPNRTGSNGWSALMHAAQSGNVAQAGVLLDAGADPHIRADDGSSCLHIAVQSGHVGMVRFLLSRQAAAVDAQAFALRRVIDADDAITLGNLLRAGADPSTRFGRQETLLGRAAMAGATKVVELLLKHPSQDLADTKSMLGRTALMFAANTDLTWLLLQAGASVHTADARGWTALAYAAASNDSERISMLIEAGAEVNSAALDGKTALMIAASRGFAAAVSTLCHVGARVDLCDNSGDTALLAATSNRPGATVAVLVQLLIDAGANIHAVAADGATALIRQAIRRDNESIQVLLKAGAAATHADRTGRTALEYWPSCPSLKFLTAPVKPALASSL